MTKITATVPDDTGVMYDITIAEHGVVIPPAENVDKVTIAGAEHLINGIDRARDDGELILYRTTYATNMWGFEAAVSSAGVVTVANDRQTNMDTNPTAVPVGGYVLSGHNGTLTASQSADWLKEHATVGASVALTVGVVTPPTTVPGAPTITGSAGNAATTLSWTGVAKAASYNVYRGGVLIANVAGTTYSDHGLTNGSGYSYQVAAVNVVGEGTKSNVLSLTPTGTVTTSGYPAKEIAVYKMMWSSNGPALSAIHSACNVVRMAFGQGDPISLVGWGNQGQSSFVSQAAAMRARGVKFVLSVGGQGGAVNTGNLNNFVAGVRNVKNALGFLDGVDWDIEASGMNQSQIRAIENALVAEHGTGFGFSYAQNGGNVSQYLPCAVACQNAGQLLSMGQQFYDAAVSVSAAAGRISEAVNAGIPISKISVGMMIQSGSNWWTNAQCKNNMQALMSQFPGLQRAYLWEASRTGTDQWAADMKTVIG